jgi:hypothetical protein
VPNVTLDNECPYRTDELFMFIIADYQSDRIFSLTVASIEFVTELCSNQTDELFMFNVANYASASCLPLSLPTLIMKYCVGQLDLLWITEMIPAGKNLSA